MVLTGVSTAEDMIRAAASERPDYLAADLRSLYAGADILRVGPHPGWRIDIDPSAVTVHATGSDTGDSLSAVRATASAIWDATLDGRPFSISAGDDTARQALGPWSVLASEDRLA